MKSELPRPAKWLIPGALILFLVPTFLLTLNKELLLLREALPTLEQDNRTPPLPLASSDADLDETIADRIEDAVKAEVRENFDLTLSLINLLLGALAVIPILGGFFLWSLQKQIQSKLIDQSEALVNQKIQESEQLAKQKVQDLIDARAAELETLKIDQILRLINFAIKEDIHPTIEKKYQQMFRQAFIEGFPSQSFINSINRETKVRLSEYVQIFQSLAESHPGFFQANANDYVWLADACFILSQYEKANQFYAAADACNPHSFRILHRRGNGQLALKNYPEALRCYRDALHCTDENSVEFRPERHAWLYHNLGKAHDRLYNYEEAIQSYRKAYKYNPDLYHSYYWEGNACSGLGRYEEAIACFKRADQALQRAQARQPISERDFKADRAWILHGTGDAFRKMGDACHQMSHNDSIRCDWFSRRCDRTTACQQRLEHYRNAINYYDQSEQINGNNSETLHKRGKAYRELGDYKQAEADYRRAVHLATEAGDLDDRCNLLANLANLLARPKSKLPEAHRSKSNQAAELDLRSQEATKWFETALVQCQSRRLQAEVDSADILEQFYGYFDTARCYSLRGEVRRAAEYMKDALAHCPAEKRALVQQWANSDSDFNNWYWYVQQKSS